MVQQELIIENINDDTRAYVFETDDNGFWAKLVVMTSGPGYQECAVFIHVYNSDGQWNTYGDDDFQRLWFSDFASAEAHIKAAFLRINYIQKEVSNAIEPCSYRRNPAFGC